MMAYEQDILNVMNHMFGAEFAQLAEKYQYLPAIWDNCSDPNIMLEMLRLSNYRLGYFEELCEFDRWLHSERQKVDRDLGEFDELLSANEAKFKNEIDRGQLSQERLEQCMWDAAFLYAHIWSNKLIHHAAHSAIWDNLISPLDQQALESRQVELRDNAKVIQAQKMREQIPAPFLPNIH
jgi:hypothetical protein